MLLKRGHRPGVDEGAGERWSQRFFALRLAHFDRGIGIGLQR
jgi:hypothetical protein